MIKIKAVIFDLDGTIANTIPLIVKSVKYALEPLIGRPIADQEVLNTFGPSEVGTVIALAPNHVKEGFQSYLHHYERFHDMCPCPFNGITKILDLLQKNGVRIAMVTGKSRESAMIDLKTFELDQAFEIVETGVPTGPSKPLGLQHIIEKFEGIRPEEMIYVGDAATDINASQSVGIPIVGAAWAKTTDVEKLKAGNPDYIFSSVKEFTDWLVNSI